MNLIRSSITLMLFLAFIALWIWAWRSERHADFAAAARLPLEGEPGSDCGAPHPGRAP